MKISSNKVLLFIHPSNPASSQPVIDYKTLTVAYQITNYTEKGHITEEGVFVPGLSTKGVHKCTGCGEQSRCYDIMLP
jgi:hypothetical protein